MPSVQTSDLTIGDSRPDTRQIYCALDCMVMTEVFEELSRIRNQPPEVYSFSRALQAPILEMMLRGFKVDETERQIAIADLGKKIDRVGVILQALALEIWGRPLNARSPKQLQEFFNGAMRLPEKWISEKGVRKLSFKREVLEFFEERYFHARPIIGAILAIREFSKQREILSAEVDADGRMRTTYGLGTETFRLNSSASVEGTGSNIQNIPPDLRRVYVADPGYKLLVIDNEQSESREVGFICGVLFDDWTYLNNCESSDLHTVNCRLVWPNLAWTGDLKADRKIAEQIFYRDFSHRHLAKVGGHGVTYFGTAFTMAKHLKVPTQLVVDFRQAFLEANPCIPRWWTWVQQQLALNQTIVSPQFGISRQFFGRPNDDATLREALAFMGQNPTAIRTNLGMYRIWRDLRPECQLLAQTHDSVTLQFPDEPGVEERIVPLALKLMEVWLEHGSRKFVVPGECKVGWNWGNYVSKEDVDKAIAERRKLPRFNPNGLKKWSIERPDTRERLTGLQRTF